MEIFHELTHRGGLGTQILTTDIIRVGEKVSDE